MAKRRQTFLTGWLAAAPTFELLHVILTPSALLFFDDFAATTAARGQCRYTIALATVGEVVGLRIMSDAMVDAAVGTAAAAAAAADASAALGGQTSAFEIICRGSDAVESAVLLAESESEREKWIEALVSARLLREDERKEMMIRRLDSDVRRGEGTHFVKLVHQLDAAESSDDAVWVLRQLGQYLRRFLETSASDKFGYLVARDDEPDALWRPSAASGKARSASGSLLLTTSRGKQDAIARSRRFWSPASSSARRPASMPVSMPHRGGEDNDDDEVGLDEVPSSDGEEDAERGDGDGDGTNGSDGDGDSGGGGRRELQLAALNPEQQVAEAVERARTRIGSAAWTPEVQKFYREVMDVARATTRRAENIFQQSERDGRGHRDPAASLLETFTSSLLHDIVGGRDDAASSSNSSSPRPRSRLGSTDVYGGGGSSERVVMRDGAAKGVGGDARAVARAAADLRGAALSAGGASLPRGGAAEGAAATAGADDATPLLLQRQRSDPSEAADGDGEISPGRRVSAIEEIERRLQRETESTRTFTSAYKRFERLGSGTFGAVYRCTRRLDHKVFAVKEISLTGLLKKDVEGLRREVTLQRKVGQHPNIVSLVEVFEENDALLVVMEYVSGGELFDRIKAFRGGMPEEEVRVIVRTLGAALSHCHRVNIVHHDLKPENILLSDATANAAIKICDFGFASKVGVSGLLSECGTPWYVAPEIIEKQPHDAGVDLWSLGVILYILLCGRPPFRDVQGDRRPLWAAIKRGLTSSHFSGEAWSGTSRGAKNVVRALLTVDPRERLNVEQLLRHPWVRGERQRAATSLPGFDESLRSLRAFNERRAARADGGRAEGGVSSAVAPAIRAGALAKEGYWNSRSWRPRWFVLTADRLDYYKKPSDEEPAGAILLTDIVHIKASGIIRGTPPDVPPVIEDGADLAHDTDLDMHGGHECVDYGYDSEDIDMVSEGDAATGGSASWPSVVLFRGHSTKWRGLMGTYTFAAARDFVNGAPVYLLAMAKDGAFVHPDNSKRHSDVALFRRLPSSRVGGAGASSAGHWTIGPVGDILSQRSASGWLRTDASHARRGVVGLLGAWEFLSSSAFGTFTRDAAIDINVFGEAGAGKSGAAVAAAAAAAATATSTGAGAGAGAGAGDASNARARVIFIEVGKAHAQPGRVFKLQCASMDDKSEWLVAFAQARRAQQLLADADGAMRHVPEPAVGDALVRLDDVRSLSRLVARQHCVVHLWSEIGASAVSIGLGASASLLKAAYSEALRSPLLWRSTGSGRRGSRPSISSSARSSEIERSSSGVDRGDPMDGSVRARALTAAFCQMRNGSITPREYGAIVQGTAEFDRIVLGDASPRQASSSQHPRPSRSSSQVVRISGLSALSLGHDTDWGIALPGSPSSRAGLHHTVRRTRCIDVWRQRRFARTHNAPLKAIVTSVTGALVASANELGEVLLWTRTRGEEKMRATALDGGEERAVTAMTILGDELLLTASNDTTVCVWALPSGVFLRRLGSRGRDGSGHSSTVSSVAAALLPSARDRFDDPDWVAVNGDGGALAKAQHAARNSIAISGAWDKEARLWRIDGRDRACIGILHGHKQPITAVALSADASLALTGGGDRRIIIWSLDVDGKAIVEKKAFPPGVVAQRGTRSSRHGSLKTPAKSVTRVAMRQIRVSAPVTAVSFLDPHGMRIVVASDDGTVSVWSLSRPTLLPLDDDDLTRIASNSDAGRQLLRHSVIGGARCLFSWCAHGVGAGDATQPPKMFKVPSQQDFLGSLDRTDTLDHVGVRAFAVDPSWKLFFGAEVSGAPAPAPADAADAAAVVAPRVAGDGPQQSLFVTTVGADRQMCVWRLSDPLLDAELTLVGGAAFLAIRSCIALAASLARLARSAKSESSSFVRALALNGGALPWHVGWEIMGYVGPGRGLAHFFSHIAPQLPPALPAAPPHASVGLLVECFHLLMPVRFSPISSSLSTVYIPPTHYVLSFSAAATRIHSSHPPLDINVDAVRQCCGRCGGRVRSGGRKRDVSGRLRVGCAAPLRALNARVCGERVQRGALLAAERAFAAAPSRGHAPVERRGSRCAGGDEP